MRLQLTCIWKWATPQPFLSQLKMLQCSTPLNRRKPTPQSTCHLRALSLKRFNGKRKLKTHSLSETIEDFLPEITRLRSRLSCVPAGKQQALANTETNAPSPMVNTNFKRRYTSHRCTRQNFASSSITRDTALTVTDASSFILRTLASSS